MLFCKTPQKLNLLPCLQPSNACRLHTFDNQTKLERGGTRRDFSFYESSLKKCDSLLSLFDGMCIHDHVYRDGLEHFAPINNLLLQMYGKCDALDMASGLFSRMQQHDLFSWNFIIRAHTRSGQMEAAFSLFRRMHEEGMIPNQNIFSSMLSSKCENITFFDVSRLHVQIASNGCEYDVFVGTCLISMYGKCGHLEEAMDMFDRMPEHDIITWNTIIVTCNDQGLNDKTLEFFDRMVSEAMVPSNVTFVGILDACKDKGKGKQIHVHVLSSECKEETIVGTSLMHMYGKCGDLKIVKKILDNVYDRDKVLLNAAIGAHVQNHENDGALKLFHVMWQEGLLPDKFTFVGTLSACADENKIRDGKRIHALISSCCELRFETMLENAIMSMYGKCANSIEAHKVFCQISCRDIVSWNAMIGAYAQNGDVCDAALMHEQMHQEGIMSNDITLVSMLEVYANESHRFLAHGLRLHACYFAVGVGNNIAVGNALISMYGKCGRIQEARRVLDNLPNRDESTFVNFLSSCTTKNVLQEGQEAHAFLVYKGLESHLTLGTALLTMYGKCGSLDDSWVVFNRMKDRDVVSWTAMISSCTSHGRAKEALDLFEEMKIGGLEADKITLVNILDACIDEAGLAEGRRVHKHIIVSSFEADIVVGTALLNMYGKCGVLEDACRVFDSHLLHRDTIAWTIMISTYAQHGHVKDSISLLKKMRDEGIEPNEITFISVLNACSHSGLVDEGRQCFASMKECGIMPGMDHYNCMLDLLTRAGMMDEAESLINEMPITPGSVGWTTILGGCRERFDAPRGERAAGNVLEMDPVNVVPPYVTLSNIYSGYSKDNNLVLSSEIT